MMKEDYFDRKGFFLRIYRQYKILWYIRYNYFKIAAKLINLYIKGIYYSEVLLFIYQILISFEVYNEHSNYYLVKDLNIGGIKDKGMYRKYWDEDIVLTTRLADGGRIENFASIL